MNEIQRLIDGNKLFRKRFFERDSALFNALVEQGQKPQVMIVACSDSRVDPTLIFNCQPGELFVVRNVANLIPPYENTDVFLSTYAALEFGSKVLDVKHIILFGHMQCGGIQALVRYMKDGELKSSDSFITRWMQIARPAYEKMVAEHGQLSFEEQVKLCEQYVLINSLKNLSKIPWIAARVQNGSLVIHAWYFDLATGSICAYEQEANSWGCME